MNDFMGDANPLTFEFLVQDIYSIEPTVKYMYSVDFGTGSMLNELADEEQSKGNKPERSIRRLRGVAEEYFRRAMKAMPLQAHFKKNSKKDVDNAL